MSDALRDRRISTSVAGRVFIVTLIIFVFFAANVALGERVTRFDLMVSQWVWSKASPGLTAAMLLITDLGSILWVSLAALLGALFMLWRRRWPLLLMVVLMVYGGMLLNTTLKHFFQRARPVMEEPLLSLATYSFPSGHALAATVLYGMLAIVALRTVRHKHWRRVALVGAALIIALVAFSRIYLGVHYLSDVLAGITLGIAWLALCLILLEVLRRRARSL